MKLLSCVSPKTFCTEQPTTRRQLVKVYTETTLVLTASLLSDYKKWCGAGHPKAVVYRSGVRL